LSQANRESIHGLECWVRIADYRIESLHSNVEGQWCWQRGTELMLMMQEAVICNVTSDIPGVDPFDVAILDEEKFRDLIVQLECGNELDHRIGPPLQ
jgi:hypothetical protein